MTVEELCIDVTPATLRVSTYDLPARRRQAIPPAQAAEVDLRQGLGATFDVAESQAEMPSVSNVAGAMKLCQQSIGRRESLQDAGRKEPARVAGVRSPGGGVNQRPLDACVRRKTSVRTSSGENRRDSCTCRSTAGSWSTPRPRGTTTWTRSDRQPARPKSSAAERPQSAELGPAWRTAAHWRWRGVRGPLCSTTTSGPTSCQRRASSWARRWAPVTPADMTWPRRTTPACRADKALSVGMRASSGVRRRSLPVVHRVRPQHHELSVSAVVIATAETDNS